MGYKCTCNLSVAKGHDFLQGQAYTGPSEFVERLLKDGLIVSDAKIEDKPVEMPMVEVGFGDEDLAEELEDKPQKKSPKKKGK